VKRIGGLFCTMISMDSLRKAAEDACRNRRDKNEVELFKQDGDRLLEELHSILREGRFKSSEYRTFSIKENGKARDIADAPLYPDRIVQWAVTNALEDRLNAKLIHQTYASIRGRGVKTALSEVVRGRRHEGMRYALKVDVRHFFASIDKGRLKERMREVVKDARALELMDEIIDGFPGDGIPLGNRTSSMFANQYLSPIDHHFKNERKCHCYVRYMDDILILGKSKPWLHQIRREMQQMLSDMGLEMKGNWQVVPLSSGVTFLGYRIFQDHILLARRTKVRILKAGRGISAFLNNAGECTRTMRSVMSSYNGVLRICNSYGLRLKAFGEIYDTIGWPDEPWTVSLR